MLIVANISRTLYGALLQGNTGLGKTRESDAEDLKEILGYLAPYFPFTQGGLNIRRDIKVRCLMIELSRCWR